MSSLINFPLYLQDKYKFCIAWNDW
jgi:hypothetical protein